MKSVGLVSIARVLRLEYRDNGSIRYTVKDDTGTIYTNVENITAGGSLSNVQTHPYTPIEIMQGEPEDYLGSFVLLLHSMNLSDPMIIGAGYSNKSLERILPERIYETDDQLTAQTQCAVDSTNRLDGSLTTVGAEGITFDTTENHYPVRIQVADDSHLRISQKGQSTTDHVVLASKLLEKLSDLENTIDDIVERVNVLSEIGADVEATKAASIQGYVPKITPASPPIGSWSKGSDAAYKASCVRISSKNTEEG